MSKVKTELPEDSAAIVFPKEGLDLSVLIPNMGPDDECPRSWTALLGFLSLWNTEEFRLKLIEEGKRTLATAKGKKLN